MAPIPPSSLSSEDKELWANYLKASTSASTVPEQFKADEPNYFNSKLRIKDDQNHLQNVPNKWYEIQYNDSTLKFTVEIFGKQPDSG